MRHRQTKTRTMIKLDSGQEVIDWEKFERRNRKEIESGGYKGQGGYAWEMAKYRLERGLKAKQQK